MKAEEDIPFIKEWRGMKAIAQILLIEQMSDTEIRDIIRILINYIEKLENQNEKLAVSSSSRDNV